MVIPYGNDMTILLEQREGRKSERDRRQLPLAFPPLKHGDAICVAGKD